jgi:1-pyrroline-5-carboxylate dehydrogenase
LKAADLLATKYRPLICASMMIGSGKNVWQAEIDAAVEMCDFFRFNAYYAQEVYANQPMANSRFVWNRLEYRPLDGRLFPFEPSLLHNPYSFLPGFVYAVSPFNFAAIGGNL